MTAPDIVVDPTVVVPSNVTLNRTYPVWGNPNYPPTTTNIQTFCQGNIYKPLTRVLRERPEDLHTDEEAGEDASLVLYPNPTSSTLYINYTLEARSSVDISIVDLTGKTLSSIVSYTDQEPGSHKAEANVSFLSDGFYLCRIKANGVITMKKVIIKK